MGLGAQVALGLASAWVWCSAFLLAHDRLVEGRAPPATIPMGIAFTRLLPVFVATSLQGLSMGLVSVVGSFLLHLPTIACAMLLLFVPALVFTGRATPLAAFGMSWRAVAPRFLQLLGAVAVLAVLFLFLALALSFLAVLLPGVATDPQGGLTIWGSIVMGGTLPLLSVGWAALTIDFFPPKPSAQAAEGG